MPDVPLSPGYFSRAQEALEEARLVNMIYEKTPQGPFASALVPRPPLAQQYVPGGGEIRAMLKQPGVLNGDLLTVSGSALYDVTSQLGTIGTSTGRCEVHTSEDHIVVIDASAGTAWAYTIATKVFAQVTDADLPAVSSVAFYAGRWFYAQKGSGVFWWSALDDPTSIDALAFADTEASADQIVRVGVLGDDLVFFGSNSVEFWYATGDPNAPVSRYTNRTYSRGCVGADTVVNADNSLMWIGDDFIPYRAESVPMPLVDPTTGAGYGIVEIIKNGVLGGLSLNCWTMTYDAHTYYAINVGGTNYLRDITTGSWSEWDIETTHCANSSGGLPLLGGPSGIVYAPDPSMAGRDDNSGPYMRVGSAFAQVDDDVVRCDVVALLTRAPSEANVSMRYMDDVDAGWSDWIATTTVSRSAAWRRLGPMRAPGRRFEFQCSDEQWVDFVGLKVNPRRI